jgi:PqqD family protein of HPr-rel-A system
MSTAGGAARLQGLALSERGFLFDPSTGQTYSLNATATFVLKSLIGGADPAALPALVGARFDVDAETAARDAEQFLRQLRELGLWDDAVGEPRP